ncbi:MAG: sensor histidine kinase [Saprospiraceae bacterium]
MRLKRISLQTVTYLVMGYMLMAFIWWAVHLWRQNDRLFATEIELLEARFDVAKRGVNVTELQATQEYADMLDRYERRRRMVLAEGLFFSGCLLFGLWLIQRSVKREVALAKQRRNFMLSITHELKSPIAAIRLVFETLGKRELDREKLEKLCANGMRDANRLQNLVEDLLLAARLEDNWRPFPEPVDLQAVARDISAGLKIRFPEANILIAIPDDFPPVQADQSGLTAVVQNLLENAVKYSPAGAPVEILAQKRPGGGFRLMVTDRGYGIPENERRAVFEKFYRIGSEETRQTTGTGLGLYIVRQVVVAHHGAIRVEGNLPQGTRFVVDM